MVNVNKSTGKVRRFDAIVELVGGQISGTSDGTDMVYHDGQTPPSEAAVDAKLASMQSEYEGLEWSRKRVKEYPSNGDQWDMIYKDNKNSTTTHAAAVEVVKTKWPKDNSGPV